MEHLRQQGELSSTELAEQMGISSVAVSRHLQELLKSKKAGKKGKGKKTRYYLP